MEVFVSLIIIIFGVLQIILFFKLWIMTNNVEKLTNHICNSHKAGIVHNREKDNLSTDIIKDYDLRLDTLKPGDRVKLISDGRELTIESIDGNKIFCNMGFWGGYKHFNKKDLKYIEKG